MPPSTPPLLKIAVDVGFHAIKAAVVWEDHLYTAWLPAVVGVGDTDLGLL